jgi:hypothetical protein
LPENILEAPSTHQVFTVPKFLPEALARSLRDTYDDNFANPRELSPERFCWDFWHVPDQYTQLRTPAQEYFEADDYEKLESALLEYGKDQLGCIGLTPIWLSYYVGTYPRTCNYLRAWMMSGVCEAMFVGSVHLKKVVFENCRCYGTQAAVPL